MNLVFSLAGLFCCVGDGVLGTRNETTKKPSDDDYYLNYDYDLANSSANIEFKPESLILPNPESLDSKYIVDTLPNIDLPDDSLADSDLRDHDLIDNIMYVYYGSHHRNVPTYGPEIIIVGSVLSCAAQLLTIFCVLLKRNQRAERMMTYIFFQILGTFCVSNLIFMLGVYATKSTTKCLIISLILYFLHLMTSVWLCLYCFYIYKRFAINGLVKERHLKVKYFNIAAYDIPTLLTLATYFLAPHSYESKRFCFISVQKGMILNYMLPVSILIVLTTIYSLSGIRKINMELSKLEFNSSAESLNALRNELELLKDKKDDMDEEVQSLRESKTCLKSLCVIQTGYDIVWFVVVLALENVNDSNGMAIIYAITSCILNWYIFIKRKSLMPSLRDLPDDMEEIVISRGEDHIATASANVSRRGSSDSIPLLNSDSCTEMRELRLDHISTISA
ncbi:unnamed protein product [Phaedon cochleariae]|uniref:G-protein coupled receptors family 2 profile 2 domain-containing protein n=1 Tax=Phaedon cochleariae TaxID=80249 RepID=A0A9P0DIZ5_PHACE|nr:unnamed protein product [Phaedon cochleariae]